MLRAISAVSIVSALLFSAPAFAQSTLSEAEVEAYLTARICHNHLKGVVDSNSDVQDIKAHWDHEYAAFAYGAQDQATLDRGYAAASEEFAKLDRIEFDAFCANQYVASQVSSIADEKDLQARMTDEEKAIAADFEAKLLGYQARLTPLIEEARVSGLLMSYYLIALTGVVEGGADEQAIIDFNLKFFEGLTVAMESQKAAKLKFSKKKSAMKSLLELNPVGARMCDYQARLDIHKLVMKKPLQVKDFDKLIAGFTDFALVQSLLNFREDNGGVTPAPKPLDVVEKLVVSELTTSDDLLTSSFPVLCAQSISSDAGRKVYAPLYFSHQNHPVKEQ